MKAARVISMYSCDYFVPHATKAILFLDVTWNPAWPSASGVPSFSHYLWLCWCEQKPYHTIPTGS